MFKNKDFKPTVEEHKVIRFTPKKVARMVHHVLMDYNIVPSIREELDFCAEYLKTNSGVAWATPTYCIPN